MRIHFLERQLGYAKGLVQAAQIQLRGPTTTVNMAGDAP
jgi:hypothetical protein